MGLVVGTNCGFVTARPVDDPGASASYVDNYSRATKFVAPDGATKITEIGWWCDNATQEADFDVGLYSHDAVNNKPDVRLGVATAAKGTDTGWKHAVVNIDIVEGTIYWIGVQVDNTATTTNSDYNSNVAYKTERKSNQASLANPWGASEDYGLNYFAFYAVYTTGGGGLSIPVAMRTYRNRRAD